jgi:hypothetical protein
MVMSNDFNIPIAKCKRCSHEWTPRRRNVTICPKCKSPYWNKEKTRVRKEKFVSSVLSK